MANLNENELAIKIGLLVSLTSPSLETKIICFLSFPTLIPKQK